MFANEGFFWALLTQTEVLPFAPFDISFQLLAHVGLGLLLQHVTGSNQGIRSWCW